jgi:hypothetical protein
VSEAQNIAWLDIAVCDTSRMQILERISDLREAQAQLLLGKGGENTVQRSRGGKRLDKVDRL